MRNSALLMGFVCLAFAGPASAAGLITGTVRAGGAAVPGATCATDGASTATDATGRFALMVAAGRHEVACAAPGFKRAKRSAAVTDGGTVTLDFVLTPTPAAEPRTATRTRRTTADPAGAKPAEAPARVTRAPRPDAKPSPRRPPVDDLLGALDGNAYAPAASVPIAAAPMAPPPADREGYSHIAETGYRAARDEPLSTFSIDVDTASYANVRRFLDGGQRPPKDAVKIEELVNYFTYDYPQPDGPHPFSVTSEVSTAPWNAEHRLVHIGLQGRTLDTAALPPANLVFLLDVSGSMSDANKLPLLKQAFRLLVDTLRPQDTVAIVVYAGAAGLILPPTGGKQRGEILAAIERLNAGGSTAGGAGIHLAYKVAQDNFIKGGNNRIILATDGDFNVGTSSDGDLVRLIEEKRESGVFLTVLGFGTGNYQDAKMEQLADKGNGNHAYIDSILEAKKVLVSEMGGTLYTIAKDVKLQVEFNPAVVKAYRLIGYENRRLANQDFNDDKKDAGELGSGHTVTALYEIVPAGAKDAVPGVDPLKYQRTALSDAAHASAELMTVKLRYKQPDGDTSALLSVPVRDAHTAPADTSDNFRFSAAVAAFGMLLRDSEFKGGARFADVAALAKGALGEDREGYRFEFVKLVQKAELLN